MTQTIGRNRNVNDTATTAEYSLNSTTAIKIADANPSRTFFHVNINGGTSNESIWIRLKAASEDNIKCGIWIGRFIDEDGSFAKVCWEMPPDNIYTGEISAIMESGTHSVHVVEY